MNPKLPIICLLLTFPVSAYHHKFYSYWKNWHVLSMQCFFMLPECVTQSCLWLFATLPGYSPPNSPEYGIFQARILEWVAISFSRGSSQPRDQIQVSQIAGGLFTVWATREKEIPFSTFYALINTISSAWNALSHSLLYYFLRFNANFTCLARTFLETLIVIFSIIEQLVHTSMVALTIAFLYIYW